MANQCLALTAKGTQCRYKAKEGTLCGGHTKNGAKYGEVSAAPEPESPTQRTADDYRIALESVVQITMDGLRGEGLPLKSEKAKKKSKQTAARRRARISRRGY